MKMFFTFVKKEFYHITRDSWTMIILLLLPVMMLVLFGYGISTEIKNSKFAVLDNSKDHTTQSIIEKIKTNEYFTFYQKVHTQAEIEKLFRNSKIGVALIFNENFGENFVRTGEAKIQVVSDGTDPNTSNVLTNYVNTLVQMYQHEQIENQNLPYQIQVESTLLYNPSMKGAYNTVPGVMGMVLMLICAMMTSISITREKETGTMEVLLASPMKPITLIIAKIVPYFCIAIINFITILLLSVFLLKLPIAGSLFILSTVTLLFIFVSLSIGLLISSIVEKQMVALLISGMVLMLPVVYFSGMMFPIESMPVFFQYITNIIPAKWYIIAIKNIMIKGLGWSSILKETIILLSMAIILIGISLRKFKTKLE